MYIAIKHIGRKYTPGEILPDDLPEETVEWLKEAGAIRETAPSFAPAEETAEVQQEDEEKDAAVQGGTEGAEVDDEDEIDEDAEAPEIDIMDGIVSKVEEPKKPVRAARKVKGGCKPD